MLYNILIGVGGLVTIIAAIVIFFSRDYKGSGNIDFGPILITPAAAVVGLLVLLASFLCPLWWVVVFAPGVATYISCRLLCR